MAGFFVEGDGFLVVVLSPEDGGLVHKGEGDHLFDVSFGEESCIDAEVGVGGEVDAAGGCLDVDDGCPLPIADINVARRGDHF